MANDLKFSGIQKGKTNELRLQKAHQAANKWMQNKIPEIWEELIEALGPDVVGEMTEAREHQLKKWLGQNLGLAYAMGAINQDRPMSTKILDRDGNKFGI